MSNLISQYTKDEKYKIEYFVFEESNEYGIMAKDFKTEAKCLIKGIRKDYAEELAKALAEGGVCPEHLKDVLSDIKLV